MTLNEYFQTPETVLPQELIHGVMRVAESPSPIHQHIVGNLFLLLHQHLTREEVRPQNSSADENTTSL